MLILTRYAGESVRIGDDVVVRVLGMKRGSVRFGIEGPREVPVHRKEIYDRLKHPAGEGAGGQDTGNPGGSRGPLR